MLYKWELTAENGRVLLSFFLKEPVTMKNATKLIF